MGKRGISRGRLVSFAYLCSMPHTTDNRYYTRTAKLFAKRSDWIFVSILLLHLLVSCSQTNSKIEPIKSELSEYIGTKWNLPPDSSAKILGREFGINELHSDFLIVSYIGEADCTACHLKLPFWKAISERLDTISRASANVLLIIRPDTLDKVVEFLNHAHYDYPIIIDTLGRFSNLNNLPSVEFFHTLLIDSNHKVIGLGNPVYDGGVEEWYISKIAGTKSQKDSNQIYIGNTTMDLGVVKQGSTHNFEFVVQNKTDTIIPLSKAESGCDCVTISAHNLTPGPNNVISVKFIPTDDEGAFHKTLTIRYNGVARPIIIHLYGYVESST